AAVTATTVAIATTITVTPIYARFAVQLAARAVYTVNTYYSVDDHIHHSRLHSEYLDEFFTLDSMAWSDGSLSYGIGLDGDFVDSNQTVLRSSGLKTKEDLLRYPLTYAAGHPYYTTAGNNMRGLSCGSVASGSNWSNHVNTCGAQKITLNTNASRALNEVQVIEDAYDIGGAVYYISQPYVRLFGLVVRKNAVLFIDDIDTSIELTFLIVESGGLLQAGSRHNDNWRFQSKLTFTYTHDHFGDAGNGQVTAGLYSAEVHHPGVLINPIKTAQVRDYMGHNLNNNGVMKGAAVFFNGNLQLNGHLPGMATYEGTWRSNASASQTRATDGGTLPSQYPMTWARIKTTAEANDTEVYLDEQDCPSDGGALWAAGARVVLTGVPEHYSKKQSSNQGVYSGMLRLNMNDADEVNRKANKDANANYSTYLTGVNVNAGIEVGTVSSMSLENNVCKLTLVNKLEFTHEAKTELLRNISNPDDWYGVELSTHVALLSRNIVVTSKLDNATSGGCNNIPTTRNGKHRMGVRGKLVINRANDDLSSKHAADHNVTVCMENLTESQMLPNPQGSWVMGTAHLQNCNSMWGAEQKFRYGASVSLDGVEMYRIGRPGNFGRLGTYGVHFHLAGYADSFRGYLPSPDHPRDLRVVSSSMWRTFARWVVVHGTMETVVQNNVAFLTYGSGYFWEDGAEMRNTIDHNIGVSALTTIDNPYWNPSPVRGFVNTDFAVMSTFWLKNVMNDMTRNVMTGSPAPVIGLWNVDQVTARLRGPSLICIGSPDLELPGFAHAGQNQYGIDGGETGYTDKHLQGNEYLDNFKHVHDWKNFSVLSSLSDTAFPGTVDCYGPTEFYRRWPFWDRNNMCNLFSVRQKDNPWGVNSENVAYNLAQFYSEFPEMIRNGHDTYGTTQQYSFYTCATRGGTAHCQFILPIDGWNACTDQIGEDEYMEPVWPSQSNASGLEETYADMCQNDVDPDTRDECCATQSAAGVQNGITVREGVNFYQYYNEISRLTIPKIVQNALTWRLSGDFNTLYYGAMWLKNVPPWFIGCAFISNTDASAPYSYAYDRTGSSNFVPQFFGTHAITGYNFQVPMSGIFAVFHDVILEGSLPTTLHAYVFTGAKTLISNGSWFSLDGEGLEYRNPVHTQDMWPTQHYFFQSTAVATQVREMMKNLYSPYQDKPDMDFRQKTSMQLLDFESQTFMRIHLDGGKANSTIVIDRYPSYTVFTGNGSNEWQPFYMQALTRHAKHPVVCGNHSYAEFGHANRDIAGQDQYPEAHDPNINFLLGRVINTSVWRERLRDVCNALSIVPVNLELANEYGDPAANTTNMVYWKNRTVCSITDESVLTACDQYKLAANGYTCGCCISRATNETTCDPHNTFNKLTRDFCVYGTECNATAILPQT
ncbi:hypothetical protein CYMTET_4023, partial [Cymbomonas tetramitiformis]